MKIIGISSFYHDSAVSIVDDGLILSANQEERFTRIKNDSSFPVNAIKNCLMQSGIRTTDLDAIAFYEKPYLKLERIMETFYAYAPKGYISFKDFIKSFSLKKINFLTEFKENFELDNKTEILYIPHHLSHASSAFFPSPFEDSAIITVDGVGEFATTTIGYGRDNKIELLKELNFPHSIGLFYSAFTYFLGFKVNSGEYKLMGLAPYGNINSADTKRFIKLIKDEIIDVKDDGSVFINQKYFNYSKADTMINDKKFYKLFGFKRRLQNEDIEQYHCDLACAVQEVLNDIMLKLARSAREITKSKKLCLAGGVALNCVANTKIMESGLFEELWIQPAAGDAGGALGSALCACYMYYNRPRIIEKDDSMKGGYLGVSFTNDEIKRHLDDAGAKYTYIGTDSMIKKAAEFISSGNVIGWFEGNMEWGPRALGNRSIIADPTDESMQKKINLKIKKREGFRPFAPSIMEEYFSDYFSPPAKSIYMLMVSYINPNLRIRYEGFSSMSLYDKLYLKKSPVPAVTHVDFSSRVQVVARDKNPLFYSLINEFKTIKNCPMVLNTSFNGKDEPIVATPIDAYNCFMKNDLDYLFIGNFMLKRDEQHNTKLFNNNRISEVNDIKDLITASFILIIFFIISKHMIFIYFSLLFMILFMIKKNISFKVNSGITKFFNLLFDVFFFLMTSLAYYLIILPSGVIWRLKNKKLHDYFFINDMKSCFVETDEKNKNTFNIPW